MKRSPFRAAAVALLVLVAIAGCSPGARPVARVGNRTITVDDFARAAQVAAPNIPLPPEQAKAMLLENLVRREMLIVAAHAHGLDTTKFARNFVKSNREQVLLQAVTAQFTPFDPGVTEAEMREMYEWQKDAGDLQVVYAPDLRTAQLAKAKIAAGADFGEVADMFSAGSLQPGGRMGRRTPGTLPLALDDALRKLPVGTIGGPYQTQQGWYLVRVLSRQKVDVPPFDMLRSQVREMVRQRKWQAAFLDAVARLERAYHVTVAPDAAQTLFRLFTPGRVGGLEPWIPDARERAQVLATFDGGTFTLGEAMEDLERADLERPNGAQTPALYNWVRERCMTRVAMLEAARRHLDEEPDVARTLRDKEDDYFLKSEAAYALSALPAPDAASLRATWDAVKERYPQLAWARVAWYDTPDTAMANRIAAEPHPASLADAVRSADPAATPSVEVIRFPNPDPRWNSEMPEFMRLQPGEWSGPRPVEGGWRVLQLLEKQQVVLQWEQLTPQMQQAVANNAMQGAREQRAQAYTDSLRRAINPIPIPDALRHVPWPAPSAIEP